MKLKLPLFAPKSILFFLAFLSVLNALAFVTFFQLLGVSLNQLLAAETKKNTPAGNTLLANFFWTMIIVSFLAWLMIITEILKGYFRRKIVYQQRLRTNEFILQEVNKINFREFDKRFGKNNLFSLLENDVLQYVEGRLTNIWNMFDSLVFILFASTGFFVNSWIVGSMVLSVIVFSQVFIFLLGRSLGKKQLTLSQENSRFNSVVQEYLNNFASLYFFSKKNLLFENTKGVFLEQTKARNNLVAAQAKLSVISQIILGEGLRDFILFVVLFLVIINFDESLTIGLSLTLSSMFFSLWPHFQNFSTSWVNLNSLKKVAEKIQKLTKNSNTSSPILTSENISKFKSLTLKNVNVQFSKDNPIWQQELSLTIKPGGKYCIVGPSGVGKTTLLKVLLGINKQYKGTIEFNGIDYKQIPEHFFQNYFAFLDAFNLVFNASVVENVSLWKKGI